MAETLRQTDPASGLPDRTQLGQTASARFVSIDLIRGAVMVLMAIDHVRVYSGLPAGGPTPGIFFTRWITHFCAPGLRLPRRHQRVPLRPPASADLSRFLLLRGLVARPARADGDPGGVDLQPRLLRLPAGRGHLDDRLVHGPHGRPGAASGGGWWAGLGVAIIALHNAVMPPLLPSLPDALRKLLYTAFAGTADRAADGAVLDHSVDRRDGRGLRLRPDPHARAARRDRVCLAIGLGGIALFLLLRGFNLYGDPRPWTAEPPMPALLSFLNTTKYPASLSFLLMTLGPTIALLPLLERARGAPARWIARLRPRAVLLLRAAHPA